MTLQEAQSVTREQLRTRAEIEFNKARESFWAFRVAVHPEMITGWWPRDVSRHLQKFYKDLGCRQTSEAGDLIAAASDPAKRGPSGLQRPAGSQYALKAGRSTSLGRH
jgi:hypothetical protein